MDGRAPRLHDLPLRLDRRDVDGRPLAADPQPLSVPARRRPNPRFRSRPLRDLEAVTAPALERPACPLCGGREAAPWIDGLRDLLKQKPGEFAVVRCASCTLAYLSPRPAREAIGLYYEGVYEASAEKPQTGFL